MHTQTRAEFHPNAGGGVRGGGYTFPGRGGPSPRMLGLEDWRRPGVRQLWRGGLSERLAQMAQSHPIPIPTHPNPDLFQSQLHPNLNSIPIPIPSQSQFHPNLNSIPISIPSQSHPIPISTPSQSHPIPIPTHPRCSTPSGRRRRRSCPSKRPRHQPPWKAGMS